MIDLHLHTTASDGYDTPEQLVAQLARAGVRLFAVTDHDTTAALEAVAAAAARHGLACLPGIEITAVEAERDVHILAYGFDPDSRPLAEFLTAQRESRLDRIRALGQRFAELGMPIDVGPLLDRAPAGGRAVGRAHVARALVNAGHVESVSTAFDDLLSRGRPGFVPRRGALVADVVPIVAAAGGIVSIAHPRLLHDDALVERLAPGVHALEAFHTEQDADATARYLALASRHDLAVSGGTDFHGEAANRVRRLGDVSLAPEHYEHLRQRAAERVGAERWPEWRA